MNRGDHKERIFCDDQDRQQFLATLEEACQKTAWQVHAFCLMSNHCPEQPLEAYPWSSYPLYLAESAPRPAWLRVDRLLGEWGLRWDHRGVIPVRTKANELGLGGSRRQERGG